MVLKTSMEPFLVGFGASGVGFGAAMWGSEVSFANNGVRRSEMWGSWPPSPPTLVAMERKPYIYSFILSVKTFNKSDILHLYRKYRPKLLITMQWRSFIMEDNLLRNIPCCAYAEYTEFHAIKSCCAEDAECCVYTNRYCIGNPIWAQDLKKNFMCTFYCTFNIYNK